MKRLLSSCARLSLKLLACVMMAFIAAATLPSRSGAETFYLTATGTDFSFSATLQATANGNGSYTAVSGSGAFGSSGLYANTPIALVPNPNAPQYYGQGGWLWDNQIFPGTSQLLSAYGINFGYTFSSTQYYIAPWYDNGYVTQSVYSTDPVGIVPGSSALLTTGEVSSVTLTAVPEPSTCAMALAGLACGGYSLFRRRRAR